MRPKAICPSIRCVITATLWVAIGSFSLFGCEPSPQETVDRTWTSTVDIDNASNLRFDTLLSLDIVGERRDDIRLDINATLAASSTAAARIALDDYALTVDTTNRQLTTITTGPPSEGLISGVIVAYVPQDVGLIVAQRSGTVRITNLIRDISVDSLGQVEIYGAELQTRVRAENANVFVESPLRPTTQLDIGVGSGNIQIAVPANLNVAIEANAPGGYPSTHPLLPTRQAGVPYDLVVGSGSASIVATTGGGTIFFVVRQGG